MDGNPDKPLGKIVRGKTYLNVTDLARRWGVSTDTISRMEKRGELPPRIKFGKRRCWWLNHVEDWEIRSSRRSAV